MKANRYMSIEERLALHLVEMPSGCIEWTGGTSSQGYGMIKVNNVLTGTHRVAWTLANGPIPEGMMVLHHCDNPPCCNVGEHLFLGTAADNMADKMAKGRHNNQQKTHCQHGHPYDDENTYLDPRGNRQCRACRKLAAQEHYRRTH